MEKTSQKLWAGIVIALLMGVGAGFMIDTPETITETVEVEVEKEVEVEVDKIVEVEVEKLIEIDMLGDLVDQMKAIFVEEVIDELDDCSGTHFASDEIDVEIEDEYGCWFDNGYTELTCRFNAEVEYDDGDLECEQDVRGHIEYDNEEWDEDVWVVV